MTLSVMLNHTFEGFDLDIEFEAPAGITALFGRSGSGKTTIINALAGLLTPQSGCITLDDTVLLDTSVGVNLPPHRRRLGYIFQEGRLFPHMTVRQNLLYGRWFARRHGRGADVGYVVEMLGIGELLDRRPGALSGGEKQRVAIGRALLAQPRLILADEPLSALDGQRKADILPYFERLRDETDVPILYVSHSAAEVARLATTVVVLEKGRVIGQGSAVEIFSDAALAPAGVRNVGAVLETRIKAHHDDGLTELEACGVSLFLPRLKQPPGHGVRVRIAAQEVTLSLQKPVGISALNVMPGVIEAIRDGDGPGAIVSLRTPAGLVLSRVTQRSVRTLGLAPGLACHAIVKTVSIAPEDIGS